jgi:hypothetical protein
VAISEGDQPTGVRSSLDKVLGEGFRESFKGVNMPMIERVDS